MTIQAKSGAEEKTEKSPYQFGVWYGIETAPDNAEVLTYRNGLVAVAQRFPGQFWCVSDGCEIVCVTHWMPLPPPPYSGDREVEPKAHGRGMNMDRGELFKVRFEILPVNDGGFCVILPSCNQGLRPSDQWGFAHIADLLRWLNDHEDQFAASGPQPQSEGDT